MHLRDVIFVSSKLFKELNLRRRRQFILLLFLTVIGSISEVVSLGALVPFLGALTQPEIVLQYPYVESSMNFFKLSDSESDLILFMTIIFIIAAVFSGFMRLVLLRVSIFLSNMAAADISSDIYKRTLYQPYSVHISRSSSEIIAGITQKVSTVVRVLMSIVTVITSAGLFTSILFGLIYINPRISIMAAFIFGSGYTLTALVVHQRLLNKGEDISTETTGVVKALQEGLGAIREVLLDGSQQIYSNIYNKSVRTLQRANAESTFLNQAPRFVMESLGIVLIASLAFLLSNEDGGVSAAIPLLGALAFGAQRLIPILQQLYGNWTSFATNYAQLLDVLKLLDQPLPSYDLDKTNQKLEFKDSILLKNLYFHHQSNDSWVLDNINLTIKKGSCLGVIGSTGGGKSTLLDVFMYLLKPSKGDVFIDGEKLSSETANSWQNLIAHVPQSIYLSDSTIKENIAFGVDKKNIDLIQVKKVAKDAQIHNFIEKHKDGYNALVGERGVRLSGGQRQRIGIARALYKGAKVLLLDEATSALDGSTEIEVMKSITELDENLTVIIIAHRISTLSSCDSIIQIENGKIINQNTFEYFSKKNNINFADKSNEKN